MNDFFAKDYRGAPFVLFGAAHLIALGVVLLITILIVLVVLLVGWRLFKYWDNLETERKPPARRWNWSRNLQ